MNNTRRGLLMAGTAGALLPPVAAAACPDAAAQAAAPQRRVGGLPTQSVFLGLRGAAFRLAGGAELTLDQVHVRASRQRLEQFTVVLSGPPSLPLEEGRYELRHPGTGRFELHLTPNGRHRGAPLYRADVSLLV